MRVAEQAADARMLKGGFCHRVAGLGAALFPAPLLCFLALFAWHVQAAVGPRCVFYAQNDLFLWNWRYFGDFLILPGGLAAWSGGLALQACHFGWPGALVLTFIVWLVCVLTLGFMKCASPTKAGMTWMLPALALLLVHSQYDYPFSVSVGAALAMGAAFGYARLGDCRARWRVASFFSLCLLVYYLAGAAFYVFALCALIQEFYRPAERWTKLTLIVAAVAARCAVDYVLASFHPGVFYLHVPASGPLREELMLSVAAVAFYASFPLCALLLADQEARRRREPGPEAAPTGFATFQRRAGFTPRIRGASLTVLFLAAAALAAHLAVQHDARTSLAIHDCAEQGNWDEVLRLATRLPPESYSQYVGHDVNQALFHTGRMPFDLFSYPQLAEPFALPLWSDPHSLLRHRLSEFHLQLGRANDAEYHAHEDFVAHPSARCLRQLARIEMVKGRTEAARLFLNVLRDDLVHGAWADACLRRLAEDPTCARDAEIAGLRALMITQDDVHYAVAPPTAELLTISDTGQMSSLLRRNPPNQMAFEYNMARCLVTKEVEAVFRLLPMAACFAYAGTPPLYEEAAMIYVRSRQGKGHASEPEGIVNGCRISEHTLAKIRQLDATVAPDRADPAEISRAAEELGLAYFRYFYQRRAGL